MKELVGQERALSLIIIVLSLSSLLFLGKVKSKEVLDATELLEDCVILLRFMACFIVGVVALVL